MYDVAIIGGGVNGSGIARDLAGRGLRVVLAEQADLASGTSSASTKLIHGGLRYLEMYDFGLVREALTEREVLLRMAPHIVRPMRFVLPHHRGLRPAWMLRIGLFLYDHLGGRKLLPASRGLDLTRDPAGAPLRPEFTKGFEYSDCWVDDARLVVLNALDAAARGADIRVRTEVVSATRGGNGWRLGLRDRRGGGDGVVEARVLVNAAGPWVGEVLAQRLGLNDRVGVRLVKGSHIVVPRLFEHDRAYIFQHTDRRVIFAIPYEGDLTLIGTTDVDYEGDPAAVRATEGEIAYLCDVVSSYFRQPVRPADVLWTYAGVRPLFDEGKTSAQAVSRDFVLDLVGETGQPALLNVVGGKITTFRHLAEEVAAKLRPWLPAAGPDWTHAAPLPGGDVEVGGVERLAASLRQGRDDVDDALAGRLARAYGTRARRLLGGVDAPLPLGRHFGAGLYQREVEFLVAEEWARSADDILWRRGKLGLRLTAEQARALADWLAPRIDGLAGERAGGTALQA
jgi:glycerol-3-phosphate dehydrogenase